jgi:hypothetical protein
MAVYGIGCDYEVSNELKTFLDNNIACMGHDREDCPYYEGLFREIKKGDIVFLKSMLFGSHTLNIKAIGHVEDPNPEEKSEGFGIDVVWDVRSQGLITSIETTNDGGYHARRGTIFREFNPEVEKKILDILRKKGSKEKT